MLTALYDSKHHMRWHSQLGTDLDEMPGSNDPAFLVINSGIHEQFASHV